jgi:chorismate dehydratase
MTHSEAPRPGEGRLRVGRIPFLVCAPYFHASLEGCPGIDFTDGAPSALNKLLASGAIDCAPSSSFEYARHAAGYRLIPGLCTSGRGEVKSVLLFSRVPWVELEGADVMLSPDSDTSNALARVLSRYYFKVEPKFHSFLDPLAKQNAPAAKVAIGDVALREAATGDWPYRYDLARVWQGWQGTPLPLGVWILRDEAAVQHPELVSTYVDHLHESLRTFFERPDDRLNAWEKVYGLPLGRADALDFFSTADYVLTMHHQEALKTFFALCADLGLIDHAPALRWFGADS